MFTPSKSGSESEKDGKTIKKVKRISDKQMSKKCFAFSFSRRERNFSSAGLELITRIVNYKTVSQVVYVDSEDVCN